MKRLLFYLLLLPAGIPVFSQQDVTTLPAVSAGHQQVTEERASLKIFPVPFRDGRFTILSEKEISSIRITNVIGQEIHKSSYGIPVNEINVTLSNPGRGIYIIIIIFTDNTRAVKRISSEGSTS